MSKIRDVWLRVALVLSLLVPVYFLVASLGTKFGLLDWTVGFGLMTFQLADKVLIGTAVVAAIGLLLALVVSPRQGWRSGLVALAIPAIGLGYGVYMMRQARSVPPIHDVSTDLENPPAFSQGVLDERARVKGGNAIEVEARLPDDPRFGPMAGRRVADIQRQAYADIEPIALADPPARAFDIALAAARAQGWRVRTEGREAGRIEATAESFWYGFTDDIVIRITPAGEGSVVDVRSISRVGLSDLGANAKRIRAFRDALIA
jgi:uncharacterized protein (DUF1499 family)